MSSTVNLSGKELYSYLHTYLIVLLTVSNYFSLALRLKYREKKEVFLEENIRVKEPITLFREWLDQALQTEELLEPNAASLATVDR